MKKTFRRKQARQETFFFSGAHEHQHESSVMNSKLVLEVESKAAPEGQVELEPGKSPLNFDVVLLDVLDDHVEFAVELEDFF